VIEKDSLPECFEITAWTEKENGKIDEIVIQFSEAVNDATIEVADGVIAAQVENVKKTN